MEVMTTRWKFEVEVSFRVWGLGIGISFDNPCEVFEFYLALGPVWLRVFK